MARVPKDVARISCLHVLCSAVPNTAKSNFGTARSNLGTSCGLSFLVSKLETTVVCGAFHSNMTEEQHLEYLLIKRLPATCIPNTPRNARRIFTSDFRRMRKTRRYRFFLALAAILICNLYVDRPCCMVERSNVWFEKVERAFTDKEWYDNFRLSKETFEYIVSEIENEITRKDTKMRKAIPSRKRVAIALYYLGSTTEYSTIANLNYGPDKP